jgi:hypothetical protein
MRVIRKTAKKTGLVIMFGLMVHVSLANGKTIKWMAMASLFGLMVVVI